MFTSIPNTNKLEFNSHFFNASENINITYQLKFQVSNIKNALAQCSYWHHGKSMNHEHIERTYNFHFKRLR